MDVRSWKKILLQWVTECSYVEGKYFSLEQTDIDEFYKNFRLTHRLVQKTEPKCCLELFLREHYPDFKPQLDDHSMLVPNEYVFVYSLLLHFACVKYPETIFHDICKRLPGSSQRSIASFFNELIDCTAINREKLRNAISTVAVKNTSSDTDPHLSNHSSGGNSSSNASASSSGRGTGESPSRPMCYSPITRSPRNNNQSFVPPTPKSAMLEERTRELYNLRAQLETERYEKGLLEVQIKQNEEKMRMLNQDYKKLQQQIQDLKNDILVKSSEDGSPNRSDDEQMKKRLCFEISQKELEITRLNEIIGNLKEEKSLVQEKLLFAERNIDTCMLRIKELEYKVDELICELEQKDSTIKFLNDNKLELEQFIAETRASKNNSRPDYLDASFSPLTDNSGNSSSPENLGRSVVDVQLREKEEENIALREELNNLLENNRNMSEVIQKFTIKHAQEFNVATAIGSLDAKEDEGDTPAPLEYLAHFMEYVDRLGLNFKDERCKVKSLLTEAQSKQRRNEELGKKLLDFEKEVGFLRDHIRGVETVNTDLELGKKRIQDKVVRCEQEIVKINEQKFELVAKLESLANDYDSHKHKCAMQRQDCSIQIAKLEDEIAKRDRDNTTIRAVNEELSAEVNALQNKIKVLQQNMIGSSEEVKNLSDRLKSYENEMQAFEKTEKVLKEKYEKLLVQHEAIKRDRRETADHLEAMRNNIAVKEFEMGKLGAEIVEVRKKNVELELRIDTLMTDFKNEKHNSDIAINTRDEHIRRITEERTVLEEKLVKMQNELENTKCDLKNSKEEFNAVMVTFSALNIMLMGEKYDESVDLLSKLADVVANVKVLQEEKRDLENKMELLNYNNTEAVTRTQVLENELKIITQVKRDIESKLKQQLEESERKLEGTQNQLKSYEDKIASLKKTQEQAIEEMQSVLKIGSEEHSKCLHTIKLEHDRTLKTLEEDLRLSKELISKKDRELHTLIEESIEVKKKLDDSVNRLEQVQNEHSLMKVKSSAKLKEFETKIEELADENEKLVAETEIFRNTYEAVNGKLKQADIAINELSDQLLHELSSNSEMSVKLEASEVRLSQTESKLETLLKEKSHTISGLKTAYESQTAVLKRAESQVNALEKLKIRQSQSIATLQQDLKKTSEERDRLSKDITSFTSQIQREQEEKSVLLSSLEQTADQLKAAICEKDQQVNVLDKNCADLHSQIRAANELCAKLQTELTAKDTQLQRIMEEQEHERDNWQTKLSEMMRLLAEQSVELESLDRILLNMTTIVENHINLNAELAKEDIENVFKVTENELDSNIGKLKTALNCLLRNITQLHTQLDQTEQKRQGAVEVLEKANDKLNQQLMCRKAEITELRQELSNEQKQSELVGDLRKETKELKILNTKLESQLQQKERESAVIREQMQSAMTTIERLNQEKKELKSELYRANENVTRLIESSESLRKAKDALSEEMLMLHKQLEQTNEYRIVTESKLQSLTEKSEILEVKLISSESELNALKHNLRSLESKKEELIAEKKQFQETQEVNKKRIEKLAVKLGETQARCSKSEHENEKLNDTLTTTKCFVEKLQREKGTLEDEVRALQVKLSTAETDQEQLNSKLCRLEEANAALEEEKQKLEASELDVKAKLTKLEKIRQSNEEKIRKLNYSLETTESTNVRLNHEIGAINSQLGEVKSTLSADFGDQLEKATKQRDDALARAMEFESLAKKLQAEAEELREQNSNVGDQLSKVSLSLEISQEKYDKLSAQLRDLDIDLCALKEQKVQVENEHLTTCAKLKEYEMQNMQLLTGKQENVATLEAQIQQLKSELNAKIEEVSMLQTERKLLREGSDVETVEVESLRRRLSAAETIAKSEQKVSTQLRLDNQILQAKYRESKGRLLEATQLSEERIKENRLEMEGKLDKMKNKMKTLYTEEVTKMKGKQERELVAIKSEMDVLKAQNTKYEEHTRKLSSQIVRLNDRILEQQKQNAILSTNLKLSQDRASTQFKRPSSVMSLPASVSNRTLVPAAPMAGNLAMEDEEGEIFNNTYLTDLQTGRMSMTREICPEELQYRNSLLPPHLKSAYAAQYDHGLPEDDLKEGPHSLDDSMSALLSTTTGGVRKKVTGITNYKRPGPPTPSKHGGRLSLGGCSEPPREVLKESNDGSSGSTKTPVRFGFFTSRFSMGNGNSKDEPILKVVQRKNFHSMCVANNSGAVCTSTPRKSRTHHDSRRLFDQFVTMPTASVLAVAVQSSLKTIQPKELKSSNAANRAQALKNTANVSAISHAQITTALAPSHLKMLEQQRVTRKKRSSLLRQRISRRFKQTPTTTDTSATPQTPCNKTAAASVASLTLIGAGATMATTITTTATTTTTTTTTASSGDVCARASDGGGEGQYQRRRRQRRDRGPRLSLYYSGNSQASPYRGINRNNAREQMRKKAHRQRLEQFNVGRALQLHRIEGGYTSTSDTPRESEDLHDWTGSDYNSHEQLLGTTVALSQNAENTLSSETATVTEITDDVFRKSIIAEITTAVTKKVVQHLSQVSINDQTMLPDTTACNARKEIHGNGASNSYTSGSSSRSHASSVSDTSSNIAANGCYNATDLLSEALAEDMHHIEAHYNCFEQLLNKTRSSAPFEVKNLQFNTGTISPMTTVHKHSTLFTLMSPQLAATPTPITPTNMTTSAYKDAAEESALMRYSDVEEGENKDQHITLADAFRLWLNIWEAMDHHLRIIISIAFFAPILSVFFIIFSQ